MANEEDPAEPATTAQRLYDVLFNLSIRCSAWLTRSVGRKTMGDDYTSEQEEAWVACEREKVATYLAKECVSHLGVGEWPAFHAQPYLAIWAVQSKESPGAIGWWAISGDVPTDYMSGGGVSHPREAMAHFSRQWSEVAECLRRGEAHSESKIGSSDAGPALAPLLKTRSELLGQFAANDAIWNEQ